MEAYALFPMSHFETRISEFCRSLLLLFPIAEPYQEGGIVGSLFNSKACYNMVDPAMSFIVEALALTPSDIISIVVQKTCQDRETQFMANLEGGKRFYKCRKYPTLSYTPAMRSYLTCFSRNKEAVN